MNAPEAKQLLEKYRKGDCTAEEIKLVEQWYLQLEETGDFEWMQGEKEHYHEMMYANLVEKIKEKSKVRRMWMRWVAAASVIIIASLIVILSLSKDENDGKPSVATTHDVPAPLNTRAVITLADGSKLYLDSLSNGTIAQENNVNVIKKEDGTIVYSHQDTKAQSEVAYNTLYNPRGSKVISLTLSDGTKVWLNSESSLKYPIAFNGNNREVEITGEAYFEVKHNSKQPFKVHLPNGSIIEDIGTAFNVNAYADEDATKTTLIEGSIKVSSRLSALVAKPKVGEQVIEQTTSPNHFITTSLDIDEVLAWKNGLFSFEAADIKTIMKEVSRWYDVDVVYTSEVKELFRLKTSRNNSVADIFKILEGTGVVHFKIEGKKVIVRE